MATDGVGGTGSTSNTANSSQKTKDRMQDLDVEQFLKLMIAELQNQDPLNPMDNAQMMEQIGQIRSIASTDKLTDTLSGVQLGQALSSASSMIGKTVTGLSDDKQEANGVVKSVSVVDGIPKLQVGEHTVDLKNIRSIVATADAA